MKKSIWTGLLVAAAILPAKGFAFTQPCQLVAKMAGPAYENQPKRIASFTQMKEMPEEWNLTLLEQNGGWFVYETDQSWFDKETCAPVKKWHNNQSIEFSPVLLNRSTGRNAVITPSFIVKTYQKSDIDKISARYGFKLLTMLPRGGSAIFDVSGVTSYDRMLEELDRDKDVQVAAPVLSEPQYRLR
ncbi:hypothetical protein QCB45_04860 [Thiomicrorhabdus sp. ZW0627]|uniref:hypothetical protein n=1 Tax=Thiomicrorhabdus sp. ZW0627 TaxID=3039774 RepID=UPI0024369261|nr:hypothetical protein [Thiomicrorhabdus sp. ZW0627]MDG6773653.1 hypothetical protein [Thiomicrorhabdus sp. ZW0627]